MRRRCVIISREQCFSTWNIKLESFEKVLGPVSHLIYIRDGDVIGLEHGLGSRIAVETPQLTVKIPCLRASAFKPGYS